MQEQVTTLPHRGANQSRYFFSLSGKDETFRVIAFESRGGSFHALSTDYELELTLSTGWPLESAGLLNQKGCLRLHGGYGAQSLHGLVTKVKASGRNLDRFEYRLRLSSPLASLKHNNQSRVFRQRNIVEIAKEVLEGTGIPAQQVSFQTRHDYPQREFVVQFQESDHDFLQRQLAYWGLFFHFEQSADGWKLIVRDHIQELPRLTEPGVLRYREQSGQSRSEDTLYRLQSKNTLLTGGVQLNDHNYRTPATALNVTRGSGSEVAGQGLDYRYGEHQQTPEEGAWLAQVRMQTIDWQRQTYQAETDCCALAPGQAFTLAGHPDPALNGDYMVISISHHADQGSGDAATRDGAGHHYGNRLVMVRNGTPYRHPLPAQGPRLRGPLTARVESSGGDYPHLDEQGRYKVRLPYDLSGSEQAQASHRVRMVQPYGGDRYGIHFPLHAGTEVALGHLNGDPDRPFILGALPNPNTPSPVNDDNASLITEPESRAALEAARAGVENQALLLPKAAGHVWLAYAEHPWTEKQRNRIESDEGGCRPRQMQRFALDAPGKDAFELKAIAEQVADYGGPGGDFAWSDNPGSIAYDLDGLQAELTQDAEAGQQVIALHDPIGISHDLAALVEDGLSALAAYLTEPEPSADQQLQERYRKKLVAETIERLYQSRYNPGTDAETLARLRLEHWRAEPANRGKPEPSLAEFEQQVRTDMADSPRTERYAKHVDEAARQAFLNGFNAEVARLQKQLDNQRLDRLAWLKTWQPQDKPSQLGSAWASFDMDGETGWRHFELSFARSIASLIGLPNQSNGDFTDPIMQREIALFETWLRSSGEESPFYRAAFGYTELRELLGEYKAARAQDEARLAIDYTEKSPQREDQNPLAKAVDTAADRSGSISEATATLMEALYKRFPATIGTQSLAYTFTAYTLNKPGQWRGAVADRINDMFGRYINEQALTDFFYRMEVGYKEFVVKVTYPTRRAFHKFYFEGFGIKPPKTAPSTTLSGGEQNLRFDGYKTFGVVEVDTEKRAFFGKGVTKPLKGMGTVGISGLAGLLYLYNLKRAVVEFDGSDIESHTNLWSAIAAVGGGINSGLWAFKIVAPKAFDGVKQALYARSSSMAQYKVVERAMSAGTVRFFGYAGAFLSGATLGIRSGKLISQGDTDAGLWYAHAAVVVTAGGTAATYGAAALVAGTTTLLLTPMGWVALGFALMVGSYFLQWSGDAAKDSDVERWLDASTFGKRALTGATEFDDLDAELTTLYRALHAPKRIEMDWSQQPFSDYYLAEAVVFLPGYVRGESYLTVSANGRGNVPMEYDRQDGGTFISLRYYLRKHEGEHQVTFDIRYRPNPMTDKLYHLSITLPEPQGSEADESPIYGA